VIAAVRRAVSRPVAAYLVSGEYAALKLLAREGLANEADLVREHFTAVRRAGADVLITYHARQALAEGWLSVPPTNAAANCARARSACCRAASARPCARSAPCRARRGSLRAPAARSSRTPTATGCSTSCTRGDR